MKVRVKVKDVSDSIVRGIKRLDVMRGVSNEVCM